MWEVGSQVDPGGAQRHARLQILGASHILQRPKYN